MLRVPVNMRFTFLKLFATLGNILSRREKYIPTFPADASDVRFSKKTEPCRPRKLVKLLFDKEIGRVARGKLYFNYFDSRAEKTWRVRND